MEQEIKLSNANFMKMHEAIKKNELDIRALRTGMDEIEEQQSSHSETLKDLMTYRDLNQATLRFVIKESVNEAVEPLLTRVSNLERDVSNLETEKYKTAYEALKWVSIAGGGVIIAFIVGELIKAVVN